MTSNTKLFAAGAALALLAPAAAQAAPPSPHQLSISASKAKVVYGQPVAISGQLTGADNAGEDITLEDDPFPFASFQKLATTQTTATGAYAFSVVPTVNTKYLAQAKSKSPATSPEILVKVAPKITLRVSDNTPEKGDKVTFSGKVTPQHDGQSVLLQRRASDGSWVTVTTLVLADAGTELSTYSVRRTIKRNRTFRVVKKADADHARGQSPKRKLRSPRNG